MKFTYIQALHSFQNFRLQCNVTLDESGAQILETVKTSKASLEVSIAEVNLQRLAVKGIQPTLPRKTKASY